ncbi:hypothetical protein QBC33DRAFT_554659 [Phialemonium atrogriseum]|uniref:EGF-like domain-containing protein n=1 Tax=Phialemonium atrogriseum TaxID=1093897 RepID=A0AAJ0FQP7_9PEZI|nr:uncharacterized protein QBC33DRAFT_554659 [Phialemonium atrogriseum]KAK1771494.1 hypothetical protein QBC33DRAFT_554659 [Phialemonium atrogriseum]
MQLPTIATILLLGTFGALAAPSSGNKACHPRCAEGEVCVAGTCVKPTFCGGFAGIQCEDGKKCVDDPRDGCDPLHGGADCGGICV